MRTKDKGLLDGKDRSAAPDRAFLELVHDSVSSSEYKLSPRGRAAFDMVASVPLDHQLGRASIRRVLDDFRAWILWAEAKYEERIGSFERFVRSLLWKAVDQHIGLVGEENIQRELLDERRREEAAASEDSFIDYLQHWRGRLVSLRNAFPGRWHVPDFSTEELIEELELALISAVRKPEEFLPYEKVGVEASYGLIAQKKNILRKKRHMFIVPHDFSMHVIASTTPTPEDQALGEEAKLFQPAIEKKVWDSLSDIQKKWLSAFNLDARCTPGGRVNMSRVAENMGRDRSSAQRAMKAIRRAYERACEEMGIDFFSLVH